MTDLSVGISDILARRECPRRAAYGARRHTGKGTQDHAAQTPESQSPGAAYGSMFHDCVEMIEDGFTEERATDLAWDKWGALLEVEDMDRLSKDIGIYREREPLGVTTVLSEGEIRVPLTHTPAGVPIFFRGRIDRLYQSSTLGWYDHVDYKTSKWTKTQTEVDEDLQMWAYNWAIHEYFPEVEHLEQHYDQFEGPPLTTRKNTEQRAQIRTFLEAEARNYFLPAEQLEDGLPAPRFNQWCPWCPIMESCPIIHNLSDWALTRILELDPNLSVDDAPLGGDPLGEYIERYDEAQTASKVLDRYEKSVKSLIRELPESRQGALGFKVSQRRNAILSPTGRMALLDRLGEQQFMLLVKISQESLTAIDDPEVRAWAKGMYEKVPGAMVVTRKR